MFIRKGHLLLFFNKRMCYLDLILRMLRNASRSIAT